MIYLNYAHLYAYMLIHLIASSAQSSWAEVMKSDREKTFKGFRCNKIKRVIAYSEQLSTIGTYWLMNWICCRTFCCALLSFQRFDECDGFSHSKRHFSCWTCFWRKRNDDPALHTRFHFKYCIGLSHTKVHFVCVCVCLCVFASMRVCLCFCTCARLCFHFLSY